MSDAKHDGLLKAPGRRVFRTVDGKHVPDGHPEAAFLAYSQWDEIPADVQAEVEPKKAPKPADKSAKPQANKGA